MQTGKEGGTWLGMTKSGKIGMLTNYREAKQNPDAKGRGNLVSDYLKSSEKPRVFLEKIEKSGHEYGGFNLILGEVFPGKSGLEFSYYCNKEQRHLEDLNAGTYALSNRYLEYPWNKVVIGKQRFEEILKQNIPVEGKIEKVFEMLSDKTR